MLLKLANFIFDIETIYPQVKNMCEGYVISESLEADARITITPEDIAYERKKTVMEALSQGMGKDVRVPDYPEDYLETTAVYRKIAEYISYHDACVFHGAFIEYEGEGYLFTAKSGTGKTTHIMNWLKEFPQARVINGDKPILRLKEDGRIYGYGTPWAGKENMQVNECVPVKAIVLLERGEVNSIEAVGAGEAIGTLLGQCYRPADEYGMIRALKMCKLLSEKTGLYRLHCNMDQSSARVAYEGMNGV